MQSSESSVSQTPTDTGIVKPALYVYFAAWIVRVVLGATFIFSGFSKAVDSWGGIYKITDYLNAWGIVPRHEFALLLAGLLATFEFVIGTMIILGAYRRTTRWLALAFMSFMTLLTLYIWIADPVADCGCFGDALILSNGATFAKNIILLAITIVFVRINSGINGLIRPRLQWIALVSTCAYIFAIQVYGYHVQPMVDFLPYPVGTDLAAVAESEGEGTEGMSFIYEKDGIRSEFNADNLPDESWSFVERIDHNDTDTGASFVIFDGEDDVTADVIESEGDEYILLVTDPARYGIARAEMANRLYEFATSNSAQMIAVAAIDTDSIGAWRASTGARYPVYTAEDTDLKMLARGDAAIVALHDGRIVWKTNVFALPPEFPEGEETPALLKADSDNTPLVEWTSVWLLSLLVIVALSFSIGHFALIKNKSRVADSPKN